jgi:AcrR family transcriptional regulator
MTSAPASPRLSSRSARTHAALIAAGFELLVERPIDAIPIDDFVAKAGVAKGSFFNHFADKQAFANAIAKEVRLEVEELVTRANASITNPVERIAGGMRVVAEFALTQPKRTLVLLRSQGSPTSRSHPLNQGLRDDIEAAFQQGLIRREAKESGVLYWLGLCQAVMTGFVQLDSDVADASKRLSDMLYMGLTGLGVPVKTAELIAR